MLQVFFFRLEVAEASRERERAKLHEATQELVQGKLFKTQKDWPKRCIDNKLI